MDRLMLPRWPTNIFYNVTSPAQLEDEYNYFITSDLLRRGKIHVEIPRGHLRAPELCGNSWHEADLALRHMLTLRNGRIFSIRRTWPDTTRGVTHSSLTGLMPYSQNTRSC